MLRRSIPNLLTLANLLFGGIAAIYAITDDLRVVWVFTSVSLALDFMDGLLARLLNARSELGKQLDSLADLVSFGLVPALVAFRLLSGVATTLNRVVNPPLTAYLPWAAVAFIILLASAWRLARFNLQVEEPGYFIGLPTPANALFWVFLPLALESFPVGVGQRLVLGGIAITSALLVSSLRLWSMKKKPERRQEWIVLGILASAFMAGAGYAGWAAISGWVVFYILVSVIFPPAKADAD